MAILALNIGKSDLLIKNEGYEDYWIPIGYDRDEPNLKLSDAPDDEKFIWRERQTIIATELYEKLGKEEPEKDNRGKYKINFRVLTEAIWNAYQNDDTWHDMIRPSGRLLGAIETILDKFKLQKIYIFVTNQQPRGHEGDSYFTFQIFQKWFSKEPRFEKLEFIPKIIDFDPRPQDRTLQFYYDFFNDLIVKDEIKEEDILAISIKGGTPQMQTALQMQGMASGISKQLFIEPQVDISRILKGKNSDCKITSYWRYLRTQKYQAVKLLLNNRWDFDGARVIIGEWDETLKFLQQYIQDDNKNQLNKERDKLKKIINKLDYAVNKLNLAIKKTDDPIDSLLNIYTQCRLYWKLNEVANFLPRLGTFGEEALQLIIRELDNNHYCRNTHKTKDWILDRGRISTAHIKEIENAFADYTSTNTPLRWRRVKGVNEGIELNNRYQKRSMAKALVMIQNRDNQREFWRKIEQPFESLDSWINRRNQLIHGAQGLSKEKMLKEYQEQKNSDKICHPEDIIKQMTIICYYTLKLVNKQKNQYLNIETPDSAPYYIYSSIKDQVIKLLKT